MTVLSVLEICAGAGGQSLGLEQAGFEHVAAVEIDRDACATLTTNRPHWKVVGPGQDGDVKGFNGRPYRGVDLLAGGVPCPPFSVAGKRLGAEDERDLFPEALRLIRQVKPSAVLLENVKGLASARFEAYRNSLLKELEELGYRACWQLINASDLGVPQLRPRFILVALRRRSRQRFRWPSADRNVQPPTVGEALRGLMSAGGWPGAETWAKKANTVAPTIVGGSKKHGGADLGPTRAKRAWLALGVDGLGIANQPPTAEDPIDHAPRLTLEMVARVQGWCADDRWTFEGRKTSAYRQIGNAFPPPVARAIGIAIASALMPKSQSLPPTNHSSSGRSPSTLLASDAPLQPELWRVDHDESLQADRY